MSYSPLPSFASKNAGETEGDELPYGWDEAETPDGEMYYIDHTTEVRLGKEMGLPLVTKCSPT